MAKFEPGLAVVFSTPPHYGTLRRYHVHPEAWLHKLPHGRSVALANIDRSNLRLGNPLVICGAGPIGLVLLLAAHAAGAAPIVITDIDESRRAKAKEYVPRVRTVYVGKDKPAKEISAEIVEKLGAKAKLVLECTGVESSIHTDIYSTKFGGQDFVIGVGRDFQNISFMHRSANEFDLRFQYRYHDTYPKAISLVSGGLLNPRPFVTQGIEAFATASTPAA